MIHFDRFKGYNPADVYTLIDAVSRFHWELWITLTFSVNLTFEQAIARGYRLVRHLRSGKRLRNWIMVAAPQAEGNPHVHLLVDAWHAPEEVRILALLPMIAGDDIRSWVRKTTPEVCVKAAEDFHPRYLLEHMVFQPGQAEIRLSKPLSIALNFRLGEGGAR